MVPVSGQNQVQQTPRKSRKPKRERIQEGDTRAHRANVAQGPGGCQEARLGSGGSGWRQELCRDSEASGEYGKHKRVLRGGVRFNMS